MCTCTDTEKYKGTLMEKAELCVCKDHTRWCCWAHYHAYPYKGNYAWVNNESKYLQSKVKSKERK